jgi:hypothetical protein
MARNQGDDSRPRRLIDVDELGNVGWAPVPLPWSGSQAAPSSRMAKMKPAPRNPPPKLVAWWESLESWQHLAFSFPVFAVLTFLINVGPFNQPILRSILYGLFEGAVLSGLLAVATRTERGRRP